MALNDLTAFEYQKGGFGVLAIVMADPSSWLDTTSAFSRLQCRFCGRMKEPFAHVFRLPYRLPGEKTWFLILAVEDVVRHFGGRQGNKNGVMWIHGPKGKNQMCQSVAEFPVFCPPPIALVCGKLFL